MAAYDSVTSREHLIVSHLLGGEMGRRVYTVHLYCTVFRVQFILCYGMVYRNNHHDITLKYHYHLITENQHCHFSNTCTVMLVKYQY